MTIPKYNSATATADKIEYVGQFLGESWKERIEGYWENQYELFIQAGTTPELAKIGADLATGELMTPVIGSLSKGNAIASDLGVLEGKLNNASKGNVGGKVVPNLQASDKMRQMTNLHPNYDCSEIADDLYRAAGNKGEIIKITPTQKYSDLNVVENGKTTVFEYHEVYSDGKYVFDPRYNNNPILKDDYIKAMNDLRYPRENGHKIVRFSKESVGIQKNRNWELCGDNLVEKMSNEFIRRKITKSRIWSNIIVESLNIPKNHRFCRGMCFKMM